MAKQSPQLIVGGVEFSPDTIPVTSVDTNNGYRWAAQERIAAPTALQFIGDDLETINVKGEANNILNQGGMFYLKQLKQIASAGEPLVTVFAGQYFGKFCVTSIKNGYKNLMDDGKAINNSWSVELKKYEGQ